MASLKDLIVMGPARFLDKLYGNLEGNAATATKLQTPRAINGTNFDGSTAITTTNWGTARNIYIQDSDGSNTGTAVSVNGGANATLKLPATIKATLNGNASSATYATSAGSATTAGTCTGNAATATKLQTARTINGTSFDGSSNITTANWGTARNITIGNKGQSVNGSTGVSWSLQDIGALALDGSTHYISLTPGDGNTTGYRLIGQSSITTWTNKRISFIVASRHTGNGMVVISYGCNSSTLSAENCYCTIRYFGASKKDGGYAIADDSFVAHVSSDGATMYFFWKYSDYNSTYITVLKNNGAFTPSDGTWMTSINTSTYGSQIATTVINRADSVYDAYADKSITFSYSQTALSTTSWFAAWNGYELRAISPVNSRITMSALSATNANGYYGMGHPDGNTQNWIRTTEYGIIPYQSGGCSALGTSSWPFVSAHIGTVYGNLSGNATTATKFNSARSITLSGAVTGTASSNGESGWSINAIIAEKAISPTNITTNFRTQTKGNANNGAYLTVIRSDNDDSWGYMAKHGSGIAFGRQDTQTYLYTNYSSAHAYIGGGNGDKLNWVKRIAFTDGTGASGTWGISISGNAATATKATQDSDGNTISSTYLKKSGGVMSGTAVISWPDTGNWSNSNSGVTFPVTRGGFQWNGQSDWVKLFAEETASDLLNLVCQFGDDANPALVFRNTSGTQVARIGADGTMTATTFSGNATSATKLETARTIFGRSFNGTSNVEGQVDCYGSYTATANQRYNFCALEIRENGLVGNAQSDIGYAPSIGFHWANRIAATLNFHSDGIFYFRKQDGVTRATIDANVNGWASSAGSATTATYLVEDESFNLSRHSFQYFNISGTAGAAVSVNDTPTTAWWHIQRHTHANSAGYYTDVAIPFNDNQIYYKRVASGTLQNGGWVMLYDTKSIIYSSTEPTSGLKAGMIWLKPV